MSKQRQQLAVYRDMYLRIFDGRCVRCGKPTKTLHEIIPISHGTKALAGKNRVPLCDFPNEDSCHSWSHDVGTKISIPILQDARKEFLGEKWQREKKLCFHGVSFSSDCSECNELHREALRSQHRIA